MKHTKATTKAGQETQDGHHDNDDNHDIQADHDQLEDSLFACMVELKSLTRNYDYVLSETLQANPLISERIDRTVEATLQAGEFAATAKLLSATSEVCQSALSRNQAQLSADKLLISISEDAALTGEERNRLAAPQKFGTRLSELLKADEPASEEQKNSLIQGILSKTHHYIEPVQNDSFIAHATVDDADLDQLVHQALSAPAISANFMSKLKSQVKTTIDRRFEPLDTLDLTPTPVIRDTISDSYLLDPIYADASQEHQAIELFEAHKTYAESATHGLIFHAPEQDSVDFLDSDVTGNAGASGVSGAGASGGEAGLAYRLVTSRSFGAAAAVIALGAWLGVWMTGASILKHSYQLAVNQQTENQIENTIRRVSSYSGQSELRPAVIEAADTADKNSQNRQQDRAILAETDALAPSPSEEVYDPRQMQQIFKALESLEEWPLEITVPS